MISRRVKSIFLFLTGILCFAGLLMLIAGVLYLKVLPAAVSNQKVISYVEDIAKKSLNVDVDIKNPVLKTELSPNIYFDVEKVKLLDKDKTLLDIEDFSTHILLSELFKKNIIIKKADLQYVFVNINPLLDLPAFKQQQPSQKSDWNVDVFQSVLNLKQAKLIYSVDKNTLVNIEANNIRIDDDIAKKHVNYNVLIDISKGKNNLRIKTSDGGHVYLQNKEKFVIDNAEIFVNNYKVLLIGDVDSKSNCNLALSSKKFSIPYVLELLDSQIVENNLAELLIYFKDIKGDFDFNVKINDDKMKGKIDLNSLSFKLIPFMDLPILLNNGKVTFDNDKINLKEFRGYYNDKPANNMDFEGTIKDYLKSVDTDLVGNAIVTNDFSKNYLSKMIGYPLEMKGTADTRVMLKSKYNKIDLIWLYRFKKGNGFITDGEESFMNDLANRVLVAKMHFEDMLLNITSLDYYAGNPENKNPNARIPIVSMSSDIDFSDGKTFVRNFGLSLPKPMPSGFVNMLIKQKLFKKGTFTGYIKVDNTGTYPVLYGDMKMEDVRIPSLRLYIKNGELVADKKYINITSDGKYRRSTYNASATINNEIKFPIVVKNAKLAVDCIDVERYLKIFNSQTPGDTASTDIQKTISESVSKNISEDDEDDTTQTFDLANLIIEKCILKAGEGFYKDINFTNVVANLTLDKNSVLKLESNKFDIAEGQSSAKITCDLKNHKYSLWLALIQVNSDIIASSLLNLPKEINGKASGLMELNTDDSLNLNGRIQFRIYEGIIGKIGLVEYTMKVAALFRNPFTMISPTVISDLVSVPEGKFDQIDGDLKLKDNIIQPMMIKSSSPQLSSFIIGTYNLETQDAALRIYTKFSNRRKGMYGFLRNFSLNALANRIPLSSRNDSNYYEAEISQLPEIDADEKDCQIFLTKVDGDIVQNNFLSSLKKIK